jgi:hypothetical protein
MSMHLENFKFVCMIIYVVSATTSED